MRSALLFTTSMNTLKRNCNKYGQDLKNAVDTIKTGNWMDYKTEDK